LTGTIKKQIDASYNKVYHFTLVGKYAAGSGSASMNIDITIKCDIKDLAPDVRDEIYPGSRIMKTYYYTIG